jgi:hypothetical protein
LFWLNKLIDLNNPLNGDIYREKKVIDSLSLQEGKIVDAQDYLGAWHLAIICRI